MLVDRKIITIKIICDHPEINWPYQNMLKFGVSFSFVDKCTTINYNDYAHLTDIDQLSMDFVEKYPEMNYNWGNLSCCSNLTHEFVIKNVDKPWNWHMLTQFVTSVLSLIDRFPEKDWDWKVLSGFEEINIEFVKRHHQRPWDWKKLTANQNITLDDILRTPELPWHKPSIGSNPSLTYSYAVKHIDALLPQLSSNEFKIAYINNRIEAGYSLQQRRKSIITCSNMVLQLADIVAQYAY
jgi:hypothetical protein